MKVKSTFQYVHHAVVKYNGQDGKGLAADNGC